MNKTFKIQIAGRVQGVGFRPFVFNTAAVHGLNGSVHNNAQGVLILLNTSEEIAYRFLEEILQYKPAIAVVTNSYIEEITFQPFNNFTITPSSKDTPLNIPLTPDYGICESCKLEITDISNRRYQYAFTTCVHCGPRYAITINFPFERKNTTLSSFTMCEQCKEEYDNHKDKRFHSQTNSCITCGIQLRLIDPTEKSSEDNQEKIILKATQMIADGKILAIKAIHGYLLCCDANNKEVIHKLRAKKKRPDKPFAVLYRNIQEVECFFHLQDNEKKELMSTVAPIVILKNRPLSHPAGNAIAPYLNQTGVMLPSTPFMVLLMNRCNTPIIATSGNARGLPIISNELEAEQQLQGIADYFIHHNLQIQFPQDDSIIKFVGHDKLIIRRSKGIAPNYLATDTSSLESILAMGSHLKSTFALLLKGNIYLSQYFGNLDSYHIVQRYESTVRKYMDLLDCSPGTILVDTHPQYESTILGHRYAKKNKSNVVKIQHHQAHFAAVLGEHSLFKEHVLGVVWDGMGWGDDNNIWGGEFFVLKNGDINRFTHFEYFDWIANDKMAKEPRLSLLSLLDEKYRNLIKHKFSETEWKIYTRVLHNNSLKTSSVARLCDAVAAALELTDINTYESHAALLLENCALTYDKNDFTDLLAEQHFDRIPSKLILNTIQKAYADGVSKQKIAYDFFYTLAKLILYVAHRCNTHTIACSGGVFQNSVLLTILRRLVTKERLYLKINCKLSVNDENISFGQLMYYQHIIKKNVPSYTGKNKNY